jgi:hypothetical protein
MFYIQNSKKMHGRLSYEIILIKFFFVNCSKKILQNYKKINFFPQNYLILTFKIQV